MSSLQRYFRMTLVIVITLALMAAGAGAGVAQETTVIPGIEPIPGTPLNDTEAVPGIAPPAVPPPALQAPGIGGLAQGASLQVFDHLNIRTGPGLNFPVLVTLAPSQNFVLEGRNADTSWLQVRVPDGRVGWVSTAVITTTFNLATLPVMTDTPAVATMPPAAPAQPLPGVGGQALGTVVNANNLNVRTGPGFNFGIMSSLPLGSSAVLEGRSVDGSWLQVRLADGRQGWVSSAFMTANLAIANLPETAPAQAPPAVPPPAAPAAPAPGVSALGASLQSFGNLIIRTGPGFNFPVLVSLPLGQNFVLEGRTADLSWLWVRVPDGRQGWVSTSVITTNLDLSTLPVVDPATTTVTPPAAPPPAAPENDDLAIGTVVNANILNVRSGPSLTFPVVSTLSLGSSVQLEGRDAGGFWVQVRLADGRQGWVSSAFITANLAIANLPVSETPAPAVAVTPPETPTEPAPGIGGLAVGTVINANILNVRSGPGLTFPILTTMPLNQSATLEGRNDDGSWLQIRLTDDQFGWVSSAFMTTNLAIANLPVVGPEAVVETPATDPAAGIGGLATGTVVNTNLLNVRSGPGLDFPVLAVLPMGESVVLEGRDTAGFWLQVSLPDGRLGWVSNAFLSANLDIANLPVTG
jgi:N-acetylmuramoyl-L-alanine amidase